LDEGGVGALVDALQFVRIGFEVIELVLPGAVLLAAGGGEERRDLQPVGAAGGSTPQGRHPMGRITPGQKRGVRFSAVSHGPVRDSELAVEYVHHAFVTRACPSGATAGTTRP